MNKNIFTTLTLTDGRVLSVKECLSGDIFRAQISYAKYVAEFMDDVGMVPFLLLEILADSQSRKLELQEILNLSIDDMNTINDVLDASMKKINLP